MPSAATVSVAAAPFPTLIHQIQMIINPMQEHPLFCMSSRQAYEKPSVEVIEMVPESIIAASGDAPDMAPGWEWNF